MQRSMRSILCSAVGAPSRSWAAFCRSSRAFMSSLMALSVRYVAEFCASVPRRSGSLSRIEAAEDSMNYQKVKLSVADRVARITLSDPATMNAAGIDTVTELADAFGKVAAGLEG